MDPHRLAEERSIALHRAVAERARRDPRVLEAARRRVDEWLARGPVPLRWAERWRHLLDSPVDELCAFLVDAGEEARALRQVTPFAGVVPPRERWRIWREVRELAERSGS